MGRLLLTLAKPFLLPLPSKGMANIGLLNHLNIDLDYARRGIANLSKGRL